MEKERYELRRRCVDRKADMLVLRHDFMVCSEYFLFEWSDSL